jgi:sugar/nucleoside kinase (ribokinase family)
VPEQYDVVAIGNAIVDLVVRCDDSLVKSLGCPKGHMVLVASPESISTIVRRLGPVAEIAGGSATNTAVGVASLGGRAAFVGRVGEDEFGRIFEHDLRSIGVDFLGSFAKAGAETSRSLILVTPDGQRTMITFLGRAEPAVACADLTILGHAKILLVEGYLFDKSGAGAEIHRASTRAGAARSGKKVALSLPDSLTIARHRSELIDFIRSGDCLLIANEEEIKSLYETDRFDDALRLVAKDCSLAALTRGERGSIIVSKGKATEVPADRVPNVVDKTGAGDLYAAGFLYGLSQAMAPAAAARVGSFAAAEVISQIGARPVRNLARMARMRGLISPSGG